MPPHQHPYLHLFPDLEAKARKYRKGDVEYSPHSVYSHRFKDISGQRNGLIYFIYNPWFEPVFTGDRHRIPDNREFDYIRFTASNYTSNGAGPYWFGNNSVRGVLAETVAKLLEEAKLPSTEPAQAMWFQEDHRGKTDLEHGELRKWTMEEFISTTISSEDSSWLTKDPSHPLGSVGDPPPPAAHPEDNRPRRSEASPEAGGARKRYAGPLYNGPLYNEIQRILRDLAAEPLGILQRPEPLDNPVQGQPPPNKTLGAGSGAALPQLLGRHRLHAAPDHRPGGTDGPREGWEDARPIDRQLQPGTQHRPLGGPRTHPDRRADADLRCRQGIRLGIQTDGLRGMAEHEDTQRRVPPPGACAHGAQSGTGDGGVEEVRDGGLRLVGCD